MDRRAFIAGTLALLAASLTSCVGSPSSISPDIIRSGPGETRLATPLLDLSFESIKGVPLLEVRINGQGPFRVLLDTGVEAGVLLAPRVVRQLGLPDEGMTRLHDTVADVVKTGVRVHRGHRLELGTAEFRDFLVMETDLSGIETVIGMPLDGVLGFPLFSDCLLTLDYPDQGVRIARGALPAPDGREYMPLAPEFGVPVTPLAFGSLRMAAIIDSGASERLYVPLGAVRQISFAHGPVDGPLATSFGTTGRYRIGRLSVDVALGQHVLERPIVEVSGDMAKIGARTLASFVVTFDRRRNVVRFVRAATDPIRSPSMRSVGITTLYGPKGHVVNDVIPGTPAAALDVQRGDQVVAIEGQAVEEISRESVTRMIEEENELVILLRRDGSSQLLEVRVPVVDLVP